MDYFILVCPYCEEHILILKADINCGIFRHGVFKTSMESIPPHSSKQDIDTWLQEAKMFGCGQPFRLDVLGKISKCGFI